MTTKLTKKHNTNQCAIGNYEQTLPVNNQGLDVRWKMNPTHGQYSIPPSFHIKHFQLIFPAKYRANSVDQKLNN